MEQWSKNHTLLNTDRKPNATRKITCRSLSQDYQQALPVRLQVHHQHRYRQTQQKTPRQVQQTSKYTQSGYWETSVTALDDQKTKNKDIDHVLGNLGCWRISQKHLVDERVSAPRDTTASTSRELDQDPSRKVVSGKHSISTHFPKDRNCAVCTRTKITRALCKKRPGNPVLRAEKFGDIFTADHKVLSKGCESRNNHRYAVVVQGLATQWKQTVPCKTKISQEPERSSRKFLEPSEKPTVIYTDKSLEFGKACEELSWNHCASTPHRSETNGTAERVVRRIEEGTSHRSHTTDDVCAWLKIELRSQNRSSIHASCFTLRLTAPAQVLSQQPLLCCCRLRTQTCCPRIHLSTVKIYGGMALLRNSLHNSAVLL